MWKFPLHNMKVILQRYITNWDEIHISNARRKKWKRKNGNAIEQTHFYQTIHLQIVKRIQEIIPLKSLTTVPQGLQILETTNSVKD